MKKLLIYFSIIFLSVIIVILYSNNKKNTMIGIYLKSTNKNNIIISEEAGPIVMYNKTNKENIFDTLKSGDKIKITYDLIMETYPARTQIYNCKLIEKGNLDNIPKETLEKLKDLGWTFNLSN
ncbi:DUF3221 domain-containing protein [Clostridium nigeriense]|uniref:DUF3221 domain-containing protein n=1 Tax=Clostridium nigeriense TaxID=1805470 RepID=UPI00082D005D|nr:DUF3221 domain-containing protein [Clostridium nigeriense]